MVTAHVNPRIPRLGLVDGGFEVSRQQAEVDLVLDQSILGVQVAALGFL